MWCQAGRFQHGRYPQRGLVGECVHKCEWKWPVGHPCTEGPLCTSTVYSTFTLLLFFFDTAAVSLPVRLTLTHSHIDAHQTTACVLLFVRVRNSFQGGKSVMNPSAQSPAMAARDVATNSICPLPTPCTETSYCCVFSLDGNHTQMFRYIVKLWCSQVFFSCCCIHLWGNLNAPSGSLQEAFPVFQAATFNLLNFTAFQSEDVCQVSLQTLRW